MNLLQFSQAADLSGQEEVEKVRLLAYYHLESAGVTEFTLMDVDEWFGKLHLHKPNRSRLQSKLNANRSFVVGSQPKSWKLHASTRSALVASLPELSSKSEEITSSDSILPQLLYQSTRGFIESLAMQINAAYQYNLFDGCAVLMRRLLEVLLILSYEFVGDEKAIQDEQGTYLQLEKIVSNAKGNAKLKLSRDARAVLEEFRTLGNFAAHKIYYNCRRSDIRSVAASYRATVEELLYKSGLKK